MIPTIDFVDAVIFVVLTAIIWVGVPLGILVFLRRFLRAYERRAAAPSELQELRSQLQELEGRVADLTIENARLREAQHFDRRLTKG